MYLLPNEEEGIQSPLLFIICVYSAKELSSECENMRKNGDGFYTDIYCRDPLEKISIADVILHFDIPIDPTVYGTASANAKISLKNNAGNVLAETEATPDGKFSFFVPPNGTYTAQDENGNSVSFH